MLKLKLCKKLLEFC